MRTLVGKMAFPSHIRNLQFLLNNTKRELKLTSHILFEKKQYHSQPTSGSQTWQRESKSSFRLTNSVS